jgi:hypothetical protein
LKNPIAWVFSQRINPPIGFILCVRWAGTAAMYFEGDYGAFDGWDGDVFEDVGGENGDSGDEEIEMAEEGAVEGDSAKQVGHDDLFGGDFVPGADLSSDVATDDVHLFPLKRHHRDECEYHRLKGLKVLESVVVVAAEDSGEEDESEEKKKRRQHDDEFVRTQHMCMGLWSDAVHTRGATAC